MGCELFDMSVPGRIQLCEAIWKGDLNGVKKWLSPDNMERTNWRGWNAVIFACQAGDVEMVRYMQSIGANMHVRDKQGRTLLHHVRKSVDLVELLLECGLDVNRKDGLGNTPLHTCAPDDLDVARRLLEAGANVYATNHTNLTPLAKFSGDLVGALLLEYWGGESVVCKRKCCNCRSTVFVCCHIRSWRNDSIYGRHVVKSLCANLPVSPENNICSPVPFMDEASFVSRFFGSFKTECEAELKKMKEEKVGGSSVSYANVWNQSPSALRNPLVQRTLTPEQCNNAYPIYGETIRKMFATGLRRMVLLERAVDSFVTHVPLLPECAARALGYLNITDLQSLILSFGSDRTLHPDLKRPYSNRGPPPNSKRSKSTVKRQYDQSR